jgi:hypothetical protein
MCGNLCIAKVCQHIEILRSRLLPLKGLGCCTLHDRLCWCTTLDSLSYPISLVSHPLLQYYFGQLARSWLKHSSMQTDPLIPEPQYTIGQCPWSVVTAVAAFDVLGWTRANYLTVPHACVCHMHKAIWNNSTEQLPVPHRRTELCMHVTAWNPGPFYSPPHVSACKHAWHVHTLSIAVKAGLMRLSASNWLLATGYTHTSTDLSTFPSNQTIPAPNIKYHWIPLKHQPSISTNLH